MKNNEKIVYMYTSMGILSQTVVSEQLERSKIYLGYKDTPELAAIDYYKEQSFKIKDKIRKHKENAVKAEKELEKLENKFKSLREDFPEEFI